MEKVLLVTLWDYGNFGNRLQAIALKRMIEECGFEAVCLPSGFSSAIKTKAFIKKALVSIKNKQFKGFLMRNKRYKVLKKSSEQYLPVCAENVVNYSVPDNFDSNKFAAAVTGSDQVWHHWSHLDNELDYYYLRFVEEEKRVSYAASFGFDHFPDKDVERHIQGLTEMQHISCREKSGCSLVEDKTQKTAQLVLDPTLCAGIDFWNEIKEKPAFEVPERYIFCMFLGNMECYDKAINAYAEKNRLKIININDMQSQDIWNTTLGSFLWLIEHAELICTDSFHCTVFSILYKKKFTAFRRREAGFDHMFDRISTLLELSGLQECESNGETIAEADIDYDNVQVKLAPAIKESRNWLSSVLSQYNRK